jgi:ankyrin repeat protein
MALQIFILLLKIECLQLLTDKGGDIHAINNTGTTSIHLASENGHIECVQLLIDKGGDIHTIDKDGSTAIHLASQKGHIECLQLLLLDVKGIDANVQDKNGDTGFHIACFESNCKAVTVLLDNNNNYNLLNEIKEIEKLIIKNETELAELAESKMLLNDYNDEISKK